jgi:hypothetical protein
MKESTKAFRFLNEPINSINWKFVSPLIIVEMMLLKGARLERSKGKESQVKRRQHIDLLLAAEFFPDENPPKLVVAESEDELHADLRERFPSRASRLSGEILEIRNQQSRFFTIDAISMGLTETLSTEATLGEVVEQLLSKDIVPLDAQLNLVLLEK